MPASPAVWIRARAARRPWAARMSASVRRSWLEGARAAARAIRYGRPAQAPGEASGVILPGLPAALEAQGGRTARAGIRFGQALAGDLLPSAAQLEDELAESVDDFLRRSAPFYGALADETVGRLAPAIAQSVRDRGTISEIAGRIMLRAGLTEGRAFRIARTEVLSAYTFGAHEGAKRDLQSKSRVQFEKVWLSSGDSRVRAIHRQLSGTAVPMDSEFASPTGARLEYPGDRFHGASGADVVQCRCTLTYRPIRDRGRR